MPREVGIGELDILFRRGRGLTPSTNAGHEANTNARGSGEASVKKLWEMHDEEYIKFSIGEFKSCRPGSLCDRCVDEVQAVWEQGASQVGRACRRAVSTQSLIVKFLDLVVYTWNAAGLFCTDIFKLKAKFKYIQRLFKDGTVIAFQETHDDGDTSCYDLMQLYVDSFIFVRSSLSSAAGGVMMVFRRSYIDLFEEKTEYRLIPGRLLAVILKHGMTRMMFICIHLHTTNNDNDSKLEFLRILKDFIKGNIDCYIFILGDFNFVLEQQDRTDLNTGLSVGRLCSVGRYWNEHFDGFDELHQQSHTRFPNVFSESRSSARLDRIYCNAPLEAFALWEVHVGTLDLLPEPYLQDTFLSDHIPVVAKMGYKNQRSQFPCIPHFVTQQSIFRCEVSRLIEEHKFSNCCWARVAEIKDMFFSAYDHYKNHTNSRGALLAKERMFWSLEALRANDMLDVKPFLKASEAAPQLQHSSFFRPAANIWRTFGIDTRCFERSATGG